MKKILCVVGIGLVVGVAVYLLLNNKKKKECNVCTVHKKTEPKEEPIYEEVKTSAIGSMYERHGEAANLMKETVETIRETVKISEDTNKEIDEVSAELDKMLSED